MHLGLGIQRALFKFVHRWMAQRSSATKMGKRLGQLMAPVESLKLAYLPTRIYKDDKFGGFVSENFSVMMMITPWLYQCIHDMDMHPSILTPPIITKPPSQWTLKENKTWLALRQLPCPTKITAPEARALVTAYMMEPDPPALKPNPYRNANGALEIAELLMSFHQLFAVLFATDLTDNVAGNRMEACAMRCLTLLETLDLALHPKRKKPMYLAKYNFLGLLRCRDHFVQYRQFANLYEGGQEGEGIVKVLRALCAKGVTHNWSFNLLTTYSRFNALDVLLNYLEPTADAEVNALMTDMSKINKNT